MSKQTEVCGIENFQKAIDTAQLDNLVVYFSATRKDDGSPWCGDCKEADPVVEAQLDALSSNLEFLLVRMDRPYWKESPVNILKDTHNVTCLPTLMRWGKPERLGEDDCKDAAKVRSFLSCQ